MIGDRGWQWVGIYLNVGWSGDGDVDLFISVG